jgi:hypothetical protein
MEYQLIGLAITGFILVILLVILIIPVIMLLVKYAAWMSKKILGE